MSEWISVDEELPTHGVPVILSINNVVQNITYMLDGDEDTADWFEPFHAEDEECDDEQKLWWHRADYWQEMPRRPQ